MDKIFFDPDQPFTVSHFAKNISKVNDHILVILELLSELLELHLLGLVVVMLLRIVLIVILEWLGFFKVLEQFYRFQR
jgi:hypothetical protein